MGNPAPGVTRYRFTWFSPLDIALLVMLIEGACLLSLGLIGGMGYAAGAGRSLWSHAATALPEGMLGIALALGAWHAAGLKVRCMTTDGPLTLRGIAVLRAGTVSTLFLFCLWLCFDLITVPRTSAVWYLLLGFAGMAAVSTLQDRAVLLRGSLLVGLCTAIYEAIILPLMWLIFQLPIPAVPLHLLTGIVAGFVGGFVGTLLLNWLLPHFRPWLEFGTAETGTAASPVTEGTVSSLEAEGCLRTFEGQTVRAHRTLRRSDDSSGAGGGAQRR
jgi:hypothetical protein